MAGAPPPAAADQKHVVQAGQSLGIIAKQHGSSISALAAANGLNRDGILREGQVLTVPGGETVVRVAAGQSLGQIARENHVSITALAAANHIQPESTLQIGQKLVLPGSSNGAARAQAPKAAPPAAAVKPSMETAANTRKAAATLSAAPDTLPAETAPKAAVTSPAASKAPLPHEPPAPPISEDSAKPKSTKTATAPGKSPWGKPKQSGVVQLYRIWSQESLSVRLVDARGRPRQDARRTLRDFLRPRDSQRRKTPNARLLSLLARVSDHFGGRPIHVVSGYRLAKGLTRRTSRHVAGEAIDFRIPGVPLTVLRDYCAQLTDVGVGYYPTTQFVHLDVRKQPARWTDWSLPGQPPVLIQPLDTDDGDDGKDESTPEEKTAERKPEDEPARRSDSPTG